MVKFCLVFALLAVAAAYPAPYPNVVGFTSRSVFTSGMDQPVQTFNVEYAVPMDPRYYNYYYPQHAMSVHDRQRRQIGFGGMGGGLGAGMAGAQAQAQSQSMGSGMGMGLGGMGLGMPYFGLPFLG